MTDGGLGQSNGSWGTIVGAAGGILAALSASPLILRFFEHFTGRKKSEAEAEKATAEAEKTTAEAEATRKDADTRHLEVLNAGWEARVNDLMGEVHKLRDEIVSLRQAYDVQQTNHAAQILAAEKAHAEQMAAVRAAHAEQMAALRQELEEARQTRGFGN
jgi:membrane protein involved in colicin uptake